MRPPANKNNVWCRNWHLRAVHGYYLWSKGRDREGAIERVCKRCHKDNDRRRHARYPRPVSPVYALWLDGGAEYWFLREQGLTPRQIGEKHNVRWESFQRTLWRRIGRKTEW